MEWRSAASTRTTRTGTSWPRRSINGETTKASYTYNAAGIRTSKTVNGVTTQHLLDGVNVVADVTNGTTTSFVRGLGLISMNAGGTKGYYVTDGHGDVRALTNAAGTVTKRYDYDAFGNEVDADAADANPFRYCGEYYDAETGSIYLRARYYSPVTGRFLSEDPVKDGQNWYSYCAGNPIRYFDPSGLNYALSAYIRDNYAGKMTVTIAIRRPLANSRAAANVDPNTHKLDNGHTFLRLDDGQGNVTYMGFHPASNDMVKIATSTSVPGKVVNDSKEEWNVAKVFEIDSEQYNAILNYRDEVISNEQTYNIETYNCTTFAIAALNRAGIGWAHTHISQRKWTLPSNMVEQVQNYWGWTKNTALDFNAAAAFVALMGDNFGYTPADAAQDLKSAPGTVLLRYENVGLATIHN